MLASDYLVELGQGASSLHDFRASIPNDFWLRIPNLLSTAVPFIELTEV